MIHADQDMQMTLDFKKSAHYNPSSLRGVSLRRGDRRFDSEVERRLGVRGISDRERYL